MRASTGKLRYSHDPAAEHPYKLIVEVDPGIVQVARALLPKAWRVQPQRYAPHISVVRKEVPVNLDAWGEHEGEDVSFQYDPHVESDDVYYWLKVYSMQLMDVRRGLGLPSMSEWSRPPDMTDSFHCTIGNTKHSV